VGFTDNIIGRIKDHKAEKVKSTKPRLPVILIFYEAYLNKDDALRRENYLKKVRGEQP